MFLQRFYLVVESRVVLAAAGDEAIRLTQLAQPDGGLHIGHLQVEADVRVSVFVIVAAGQLTQALVEALAAGVVLARLAVAVAAPVAEAARDLGELAVVDEDRAALAHGDVVGGVETDGGEVAEGTGLLAVVGGSHAVAIILNHPKIVLLGHAHHFSEIEGVAQTVGQHNGFGLLGNGLFELGAVDVIGWDVGIEHHRHAAVLDHGVDGGREAGGHRDDLVAGLDLPLAELGRGQRVEGHQIGTRPAVDQQAGFAAKPAGKLALEFGTETAGGQPAVHDGIHPVEQVFLVQNLTRYGNVVVPRYDGPGYFLAGRFGQLTDRGLVEVDKFGLVDGGTHAN